MRIIRSLTALPAMLLIAALLSGTRAAETWTLEEEESRIGFTAFQEGQPVEGSFEGFTAEIVFDQDDLAASRLEVVIDTASIQTGHKDRDTTLRGSSFFEVEQWPTARFVSDELVDAGGDTYEAHGQLTIRDVTNDATLPFELTIEDHPRDPDLLLAQAAGELTISRLEYGVGQGDFASTSTVGEDVVISIEIDATRPRAE